MIRIIVPRIEVLCALLDTQICKACDSEASRSGAAILKTLLTKLRL